MIASFMLSKNGLVKPILLIVHKPKDKLDSSVFVVKIY